MQTVVEERGMSMELHDAQFKRIDERILESNRRIGELAEDTSRRFDEANRRLDETNHRITETSTTLQREIKETREAVKDLGQQMHSLQITFIRGHFALVASVVGAIFAVIIKGG